MRIGKKCKGHSKIKTRKTRKTAKPAKLLKI
jgi:hypothetical protein